jgi:ElaB/YqjD/DUF883 family membrane-anchored ribosome-binding protein
LRVVREEVDMAIATPATTTVEGIRERLTPALDTIDETMRRGRRVVVRGQHAVEDAAAAAALTIRRRPLSAIVIAAFGGALVGALTGFGIGRLTRRMNER